MKSKSRLQSAANGEADAPTKLGQGTADLVHDLIELIELQFQLLAVDLREGRARAFMPIFWGGMAMILFLSALPVLLFGAGWLLASSTTLSMPAAFAIVGLSTLAISGILTMIAYYQLTHIAEIFQRSQRELSSNLRWFKRTLKRLR